MKSTISAKGQITVPVEYRNRLGLKKGTVLVFELRDDGLLLRKGSRGVHPVDRVFGSLDATDKKRRPDGCGGRCAAPGTPIVRAWSPTS